MPSMATGNTNKRLEIALQRVAAQQAVLHQLVAELHEAGVGAKEIKAFLTRYVSTTKALAHCARVELANTEWKESR